MAAVEVSHRVAEIRVIEEIKHFGSELKGTSLGEGEAAAKGEIYLSDWKPPQAVASQCTLSSGEGDGERSPVDVPAAGRGRVVDIKGNAGGQIRSKVK